MLSFTWLIAAWCSASPPFQHLSSLYSRASLHFFAFSSILSNTSTNTLPSAASTFWYSWLDSGVQPLPKVLQHFSTSPERSFKVDWSQAAHFFFPSFISTQYRPLSQGV